MITARRLKKLVKHDVTTLAQTGNEETPVIVHVDGKAMTVANIGIETIDDVDMLVIELGSEMDRDVG